MRATAYYNEIDPFAAAWLRQLIADGHVAPGDVDERSIVDVSADDVRGYTQAHFFAGIGGWSYALRLAGWPDDRPVWTGSCPCQPFSSAGKQVGGADDRHLWPHWARLISECRPVTVFGEQVESAINHGWLDAVCDDLEEEGYACGPVGLPASSVGAPHPRARLWFVADTHSEGLFRSGLLLQQRRPQQDRADAARSGAVGALGNAGCLRTERSAGSEERQKRAPQGGGKDERRWWLQALDSGVALDAGTEDREPRFIDGDGRLKGKFIGHTATNGAWANAEWIWCRDGVYRAVEPGTFPLAPRLPGDVDKIRAFGNSIVPEVAAEVIRAYMDITEAA